MDTRNLKQSLIGTIEHANEDQLKEICGLVINYLNGNSDEGWTNLSEEQRSHINKSIKQADNKETNSLSKVLGGLKSKYGIND